jgi:hypothetical protein
VPHACASIRAMHADDVELAGRPRWRGQPGRLEVHYLTATDEATGTGLWLHHEVVAPTSDEAYAHGWLATFPVDGEPSYERFGPSPVVPRPDGAWFHTEAATMTSTAASGGSNGRSWDLHWDAGDRPLWTFPRWAWRRQALPAAQVLPTPRTRFTGALDGRRFDGHGGVAHIYGHGNAQRWAWLHADLGGGDVLEIVAATARRPGLRALPPLPLMQLRCDGADWPHDPLAAAPLLRARIDADGFRVRGVVGTRRLRVTVAMPAERCVAVAYTDPDGATATCTNTGRADVTVTTQDLTSRGWRDRRSWRLDGTGHAEVGSRP